MSEVTIEHRKKLVRCFQRILTTKELPPRSCTDTPASLQSNMMHKSPSGAQMLQLLLQQYSPVPQTLVPHSSPCKYRPSKLKKSSVGRSSSMPPLPSLSSPFFVGDAVGTTPSSSGGNKASSSPTVGLGVGSRPSSFGLLVGSTVSSRPPSPGPPGKGPSPMPGPRINRFSVPSFSCQWLSIKDADVAESDPSTVTDTSVEPTNRRPWITTSREPL